LLYNPDQGLELREEIKIRLQQSLAEIEAGGKTIPAQEVAAKLGSDKNGEQTAVIVPIELWREIESEKETAYLLKSRKMKNRLRTSLKEAEPAQA
jgi:hypothetical protein